MAITARTAARRASVTRGKSNAPIADYVKALPDAERRAVEAGFDDAARAAADVDAMAVATEMAEDLRLLVAEFVALGEVDNLETLLTNIRGLAGVDRALALAAERRRSRP